MRSCMPREFDLHKNAIERMQPETGENLLDFLNGKDDFHKFHQRTLGYCYGHSTLTRHFNYLAIFDANNSYRADVTEEKIKRSGFDSIKN